MEHEPHLVHEAPARHVHEKKEFLIPISILIAALLVSASMFYNTSVIVKSLGKVTTASAPASTAPSAAAAQNNTPQMVTVASRNDEPTLGNKDAKVTIVEFADFQCPFCKQFFQNTFSQIKQQYVDTGKVKYVFRHFPLTQIHVNAQISGIAAECANQQGKFWDFHNVLYTSGQSDGSGLDAVSLKKYADTLGLNKGTFGLGKNKFNDCLDGSSTLATVQADQKLGVDIGVQGTPSFIIMKGDNVSIDSTLVRNGNAQNKNVIDLGGGNAMVVGSVPFATMQPVIDAALK